MSITDDILAERRRQEQLAVEGSWVWSFRDASESQRLTVLVEEVGEVASAAADRDHGSPDNLREELIQVAAVCIQWIECLDREHLT